MVLKHGLMISPTYHKTSLNTDTDDESFISKVCADVVSTS